MLHWQMTDFAINLYNSKGWLLYVAQYMPDVQYQISSMIMLQGK